MATMLSLPAALMSGADPVWLAALDALIKVTLVLAAAGIATLALSRASAATRHLVWTLALVGALALPMLSFSLPRWQLPVFTLDSPQPQTQTAAAIVTAPAPPLREHATPEVTRSSALSSTPLEPAPVTTSSSVTLPMLLVGIWGIGLLAIVGRLAIGIIAVQWVSRRTPRTLDAPWLPLAVALAADLGITRRLTFRESATATMPMACGILRPSVLMPADAVRWPVERLRIVLLHELAHVKRRDCLTHAIVQLACAFYWFNPLAWVAARHVRTERERACDDLVLASGTRGSDYAEELLEIARVMRGGRFPALLAGATLAMAHRSQLEGRLIAILDPKVPRSGISGLRTAIVTLAAAVVLAPLAMIQPWQAEAASPASTALVDAVLPVEAPLQQAHEHGAEQSQPRPNPTPRPEPRSSQPDVAAALAATDVQGTAQEAAQIAVQSGVQGAVQGAVQAAVWGALGGVGVEVTGQDAKRPPADPRLVAALTAALKDSDKEVRETAMHALIQLRDPAIFEPLVQALRDSAADVREQAAHGLSQLRDKRAVEPLVGALKDSNPSVREAAAHGLSQLRDPRAVDGLIAALADENPSVREQAAFALGQIRDLRSVDPLIGALKDQNADVREQVAFALSQLRDKRAAAALAQMIKDPSDDVRERAVFALGQLRDASAVDGLTLALRDAKPDVRQQAAFALGQIRDGRSVQPLISALKDQDADVRQQAAFALGQIRDRAAVEALVIALKDQDADVRQQVAFALGQIRDPRAIEGLTAALKDASADVRQQAAFALGQLAR